VNYDIFFQKFSHDFLHVTITLFDHVELIQGDSLRKYMYIGISTCNTRGCQGVYFVLHLRLILGRIPSSKPSRTSSKKFLFCPPYPPPKNLVFRPPDRFLAVFGPPGPPRHPHTTYNTIGSNPLHVVKCSLNSL
jgi:hypothetical protein